MNTPHFFGRVLACALTALVALAHASDAPTEPVGTNGRLVALWSQEQPAFGLYVTQHGPEGGGISGPATFTVQTGRELAQNPLLDFAFLSLEQHYDAASARNVFEGMRGDGTKARKSLLVRIPPISTDGVDAVRARVRELLALGADGVVIPHVLSLEEARIAVSFFEGVDVWSPANPDGTVVAMLIIEDPQVFDELEAIAAIPGYGALVCGIGSLTNALGGDRVAAEVINLKVLAQSAQAGLVDLITVDPASVALRVEQGYLGLLAYGPETQEALRLGRAAAGRR